MAEVLVFTYESASLNLTIWDEHTATILSLYSRDRRKGHATQLLKNVTEFADSNKLHLILEVVDYGKKPKLSQNQLIKFYEKFGFVAQEGTNPVIMER